MPIGILGSLAICTILYILVAGILTGLVKYTNLDVPDPIAIGIDITGVGWGSKLVKLGAICGLSSTMVVMFLGQSRVFFSMSKDGLLPTWASKIHPRFRTPYISTILVGVCVATVAALTPIAVLGSLVSIGTLLAFVIVCGGVWIFALAVRIAPRVCHSLGSVYSNHGHPDFAVDDVQPGGRNLGAAHYLAGDWAGDLFRVQQASQPRR